MARTLRIGTFNAENLFARYRFRRPADAYTDDGFTVNDLAFDLLDEAEKRISAEAIREVNADVMCLQEVESLPVLDRFKARFLPKAGYDHRVLLDCFDPRHIDVAVLSRHPITSIRTYRHERVPQSTTPLFSRDCLEVTVDVAGTPFTVFVNHLKSMMEGREKTMARRNLQAEKVRDIVRARAQQGVERYAVVGDLNDYPGPGTALGPLFEALVNVVDFLPPDERWTHHWAEGGEYRQLDYIFLPEHLVDRGARKPCPGIMRKGLPLRALRYEGPRFREVGESDPKASDHCPVYVDLPLG
jgi:endonuclease/exonuclease/phosphatase family metal-dependent hydrolase